ncbi:MAG: VRR-NUC domain-containing protein [Microcoleus sp.]
MPVKHVVAETEDYEQIELIKWCAMHPDPRPSSIYAIPNGEKRSPKTGAKLKRLGVKAGIPDLFLSVAAQGFHGLYIEMKKKGGRISDDQKIQIQILKLEGYRVEVCWSKEEAIAVICDYLEITS